MDTTTSETTETHNQESANDPKSVEEDHNQESANDPKSVEENRKENAPSSSSGIDVRENDSLFQYISLDHALNQRLKLS